MLLIKRTIGKIGIKIRIQGGRYMLSYGYRLKFLRKSQGMTQQELGLAVGFSPTSADVRIAQYKSGSRLPKADISRKIAQTLGIEEMLLTTPVPTTEEEWEVVKFWSRNFNQTQSILSSFNKKRLMFGILHKALIIPSCY